MSEKIIPTHADSYDSLNFVHTQCVSVYKKVGYTPLQVIQDIKPFLLPGEAARCTYVGRLDPMAEGWMHVMWSGDLIEKDSLLALKKTYEVDIVFGVSTDTGDVLGLVTDDKRPDIAQADVQSELQNFVGPFTYPYPTYSSPHMKKTLQGIDQEMRMQKGHVYNAECVSAVTLESVSLSKKISDTLSLVHMPGDFRVKQIQDEWKKFFNRHKGDEFLQVTVRITCGAGTYMRTLAEELGKKFGASACALSIRRIGMQSH